MISQTWKTGSSCSQLSKRQPSWYSCKWINRRWTNRGAGELYGL